MKSGFDAAGRTARARERSNGKAAFQEDKLLREEFGFSGRDTALGLRSRVCHWESAKALHLCGFRHEFMPLVHAHIAFNNEQFG
jgi:hypothetical protein